MNAPPHDDERLLARLKDLPAAERAAELRRICAGDESLRRRMEARLRAHDEPTADLMDTASVAEPVSLLAGEETIGRYKLRQKLGEGGCGIVYLADQSEPVRRRVALKVIKLGMDTKSVIGRFEAERQALALMDHPNIAKVFDAGTTGAGRPYFVMELVRGQRITDYCDQHSVSTQGRIELFILVCRAIQHAHQKGIIHRDIKPSNIMVTVHDGVPVPKVIDFGIAKSIHGRLSEATVFTGFEQFIGTPAYMSPEQAELSGVDIDTRSDIYSLGIVLYELLTGRLPFDPKTITESGLDEMRRLIREVDPPRPSTRLGALTQADFSEVAARRGALPAHLSAELRGDLDWIVMKAIEKLRARRYESADALALDLTRHLRDEPVTARPPSAVYHLRKLVARHRVAVTAAAAVALALVAGTVVSTWQAVRARRAERVAQGERTEARRSQDRAEDLLAFMLGDLRTQLEKVGRLDVLESVGEKAMAYFSSLNPRDLTDATLARQAKALTQIGEIRMKQGRYAEALRAFSTAYERVLIQVARHPKDTGMLFERGQAEYWIGAVHRAQGGFAPAKDWWTRYRDTGAALLALEPAKREWQEEAASGLHNLAVLKKDNGNLNEARADFTSKLTMLQTLVAAKPEDRHLKSKVADTESWLGSVAELQGDFGAALMHFTAEGRGLEELQRTDANDMNCRYERADSLSFQVGILAITGERVEAKRRLSEARKLMDGLVAHDPANREWAISSHRIRLREADLAWAAGDVAHTRTLVAGSLVAMEDIVAAVPTNRNAKAVLSSFLRFQAELIFSIQPAEAEAMIARALQLAEEHLRARSVRETDFAEFAHTCTVAGYIAAAQGREAECQAFARRALEILSPRIQRSVDWRLLDPAARAHALLNQADEFRRIRALLDARGYVPLKPWPEEPFVRNQSPKKSKTESR